MNNQNSEFERLFFSATSYANLGKFKEALQLYERAYTLRPGSHELLWNVGIINEEVGQLKNAIKLYELTLELNPDADYLLGNLFLARAKACDWSSYEIYAKTLIEGIQNNRKVCPPFVVTVLTDSPELQLRVAGKYGNDLYPEEFYYYFNRAKNHKIKIGYFSADFHNHATAFLMMELFELHDKEKFELFAFSFGPNIQDESRERIVKSFDHFIDVSSLSDDEVVKEARDLNIDIAVDLKGYTRDMRMGIFSKRVAPIQINYLGYPGTMGVNYYDYIIADKVLIPDSSRNFYSERIIYLPDTYQPNDARRYQSDSTLTKEDLGFPENAFIFCCFNSSYKLTPQIFTSWARILKKVPNSILWLYEDNSIAAENLRVEADRRNIGDRIVFAKKLPLQEHLMRLAVADVVLDTHPYGAHTTASDALLVGVPVITLMGDSFASRVASSLLTALGLEELITHARSEYEDLAILLATDSSELLRMKNKTKRNRGTKNLFSGIDFVAHIEKAYVTVIESQMNGSEKKDIYVN